MYRILLICFFSLSGLAISPLQANCVGRWYHSVPGRPVSLDNGRARAYCACSRCGWGSSDIFFCRRSFFFFSPPSVWGGWMDDFLIESQLYQDDGWVMDDCAQWKSHLRSKDLGLKRCSNSGPPD